MNQQKVVISEDIRSDLQDFMSSLTYNKAFILTDRNTLENCFPVIKEIPAIQNATSFTIAAGDEHKNETQLHAVWDFLSNNGASRDSILINLGGGMVTDLGGFAGATFKRGIRTINIPTTLMAAVDAAVGGKTGINFNGLKNEVGAFYPPLSVFIDCHFLQTLDLNNILSGYAEMLKHGLISSPEILMPLLSFDLYTQSIREVQSESIRQLSKLVAQSVAVKQRIVEADPLEKNIRKALNFGHTIGHAFESLSFELKRPLLHGHAVAAGMVSELYLSHKLCRFPMDKLSQIVYFIKEYYPAFYFDCKAYDTLYEFMTHDKKNEGGKINFSLLSDIGEVQINQSVSQSLILESLDFYRESFGV
ncbi:3-dehydroquinate synthase [Parabacteroides sp. PF5-9]|uniref:3-dehydroquinate synthase n=1 Tax=Parabacteroides sp. PF5-9 TaxID=1742404 RepID=UPI002476DA3E|nr:3-dehydroquinate synthase [Parabacteroides sp. PF5-9]MDH6357130.1 3-dehydroquinate synthase [Parabacteroides sp. PF5-9]